LIDSDALLQFLIAEEMRQLHALKHSFNIQPAIVEAVEVEIRKSRKFPKFNKHLQKAIDSETIMILDARTLPRFITIDANATYNAIETRGFQYAKILDYGEAYTFAAGVVLRTPVLSHDITAIKAASRAGLDLPEHILRAFDLFVLYNQCGLMSESECDAARKILVAANEWVPTAFQRASYIDGLNSFFARMLEGSRGAVGFAYPQNDLDIRLILTMTKR